MAMTSYRVTRTQQFQSKSGRYVGLGVVVALHIALIYLFVYALQRGSVEVLKGPVEVSEIKEPKPEQKEIPPPPPDFKPPPPPFVPPPEINIATTTTTNAGITATTVKPVAAPPPAPPAPPHEEVTVQPKSLRNIAPGEEDYPAIEKRLGHEGVVTVAFKVGLDGKAIDVTVEKSSGYPRLDSKAVDLVASKGSFTPGSVGGKPTVLALHVNIRFQLND